MNIKHLIERLEDLRKGYGDDLEVRLAIQPNYPFEHRIASVKIVDPVEDEEYDEMQQFMKMTDQPEEDRARCHEEMQRIEQQPKVVYLCEGGQIGYASRNLWS